MEADAREKAEMARAQEEAERRIPPPPSLAGLPPPMDYEEVSFDNLDDELEGIVIDTGMATVKVQCIQSLCNSRDINVCLYDQLKILFAGRICWSRPPPCCFPCSCWPTTTSGSHCTLH